MPTFARTSDLHFSAHEPVVRLCTPLSLASMGSYIFMATLIKENGEPPPIGTVKGQSWAACASRQSCFTAD